MCCSLRISHLQMCSSHNINKIGAAERTFIKTSGEIPDGWIESGSVFLFPVLLRYKCSAAGKPGELFRMLRRCSPKRSRNSPGFPVKYRALTNMHWVTCFNGGALGRETQTQIQSNRQGSRRTSLWKCFLLLLSCLYYGYYRFEGEIFATSSTSTTAKFHGTRNLVN